MKRFLLTALVLIVLAGGGYWLFQQGVLEDRVAAAETSQDPAPLAVDLADENEVEVLGRLVPGQYRELNFRASGVISEVAVEEGQPVEKGAVVARLRDEQQMKLAISQARLEVINAEKALTDLDLNAPLQAAQAFYDMALVEKEMEKIQKRRTAMNYPRASEEEISDAYDEYLKAEDTFKQVADNFKATDDVYKGAKRLRDDALGTYNWLISKYSDLEKREAEANYQLHERRLADLERQYNIYSKGPDPDELAIAEARLDLAREQLAAAEAVYEDLTLNAPFAGTVVRMDLEEGQVIGASQPVLTLADLSKWHIETEDLTELSVIEIEVGNTAKISIDALPDMEFTGTVVEIKPIGETRRGDITYTVVIALNEFDPRLRWNMTTPVSILID